MMVWVFAMALTLGANSPVSPAIPNTPAGQRFGAWLSAYNTGTVQSMRKYLQKYNPKAMKQIPDQLQFRRQAGAFDLRKVENSAPYKITALLQEHEGDQFLRLTMELSLKPPHDLLHGGSILVPAEPPPEFAPPHLSESALVAQLRTRLDKLTAQDKFSGTVLIAKNGRPVFTQAFGLADRARRVPNTLQTKFRIGSMNKMFTATAIMQLVQANKIELDKPFGAYVKDYPKKSVSSAVTIRQLLTHTGGTGDIFTPEYAKSRLNIRTVRDYIAFFGNRPLLFKPGTRFDYSNYGFIILGRVIEAASGQDYYSYVRDHVFVPAGMESSGSEPEDTAVANRAIGYTTINGGVLQPNTQTLGYRGSPAGGGYSTVGDLLSFANALQSNKLLKREYTQMMLAGKVSMGAPHDKYAFGFGDRTINGIECYGHNGGAPGMGGDLDFCPSVGYTIAVLSNRDPEAMSGVVDFIENRLPKQP